MHTVAAWTAGKEPWEIRFTGTLQTLQHFLPLLWTRISVATWCEELLAAVATHRVGNRPNRTEPRCCKRRPKPYDLLTKPRREYKTPRAA